MPKHSNLYEIKLAACKCFKILERKNVKGKQTEVSEFKSHIGLQASVKSVK